MKKILLIFFLLIPAASWAQNSLQELRKIYFKRLDYNQEKILKIIPTFENELITYVDPILKSCEKNECKLNQEDALILVYASMYIRNTSDAVAAGVLDLTKIAQLSDKPLSLSENEIFAARELYRIRLFEQALKVLTGDKLVEGFKLGAEIWYERFANETVSEKLIKSMMKLAKKEALPNIFSTIIIANEVKLSVDDQAKLNKLRKKALNRFRLGMLKRSPRPHDNTPLAFHPEQYAPFAQQAARVILADSTLEESIQITGFSRSYDANVALQTYQSLFKEKTEAKTNQWSKKPILLKRIEMTKAFIARGSEPQITLEENRNLYSCASCHSAE